MNVHGEEIIPGDLVVVRRVSGEGAGRLQKRARPSALLTGSQQAPSNTDRSRNSSISKLFRNMKVDARENSEEFKWLLQRVGEA